MLLTAILFLLLETTVTIRCHDSEESVCESGGEWKEEEESVAVIDWSLNDFEQDDERLVRILREKYLIPPPDRRVKKLNLAQKGSSKTLEGQYGQPLVVDEEIYKGKKTGGFFIEAGAYDGEVFSNTLFFEVKRNWTGLLIEPNPDFFSQMLSKNRQAHLLPHCLSTKTRPEVVDFDASALIGGIIQEGRIKPGDIGRPPTYTTRPYHRRTLQLQCFPLYSLLLALDNPTVHYLSLDIEGAELPVLRTVPWDKVDVRVVDVELNHVGKVFDGSVEEVEEVMAEAGFEFKGKVGIDALFVKKRKRKKKDKRKIQ